MTTKSVSLTDWTTAGGIVYPPGEHELDEDTAQLLTKAQEREDARLEAARAMADEEAKVPERQTMIGVHQYVGPVFRPDLADPNAAVHPEAEARAAISSEARQMAFDLRVDSNPSPVTPAAPQEDNTQSPAPARSTSTSTAVSSKPAPAPKPASGASGGDK